MGEGLGACGTSDGVVGESLGRYEKLESEGHQGGMRGGGPAFPPHRW